MVSDYLVYVGVPAIAVGIGWWTGARANNVPEVLAAAAILTGLIFGAFSQGFDFSSKAAEKINSGNGHAAADLTDHLRANVSYTVLLGIVLTTLLGAAAMFGNTDKPLPVAPTLVIIFLSSQMLLTLFMILKRIRAIYMAFDNAQPERIP
jgi:cytochrome bd-type quinol oxidase subunit 2